MAKYGINALVIGERIKQELKKQGKTSVWLAEQLGCHRTNIYIGVRKSHNRYRTAVPYQQAPEF